MCFLYIATISTESVYLFIGAICTLIVTIIVILRWLDDKKDTGPNLTKLTTGQATGKWVQFFIQNTGDTLSSVELTCDDAKHITIDHEKGAILSVWEKGQKAFINIDPKCGLIKGLSVPFTVSMHYRNLKGKSKTFRLILQCGTKSLYPSDF